jgi:hypothetical protein
MCEERKTFKSRSLCVGEAGFYAVKGNAEKLLLNGFKCQSRLTLAEEALKFRHSP